MIAESELLLDQRGAVYHLGITPEWLCDRVILVGDPARVDQIAAHLDRVELRGEHREFRSVVGWLGEKRILVISTGISSDCVDIVLTELDALANIDLTTRTVRPVHRSLSIVRIGTCGGFGDAIALGDAVVTTHAVGGDGALNYYAGTEVVRQEAMEQALARSIGWNDRLPALYVVQASEGLVDRLALFAKRGATFSAGGFFGAQGRHLRLLPLMPDLVDRLRAFDYEGVRIVNMEMEGAAVTALARMLGHQAATVCLVIAHRAQKQAGVDYEARMDRLITQVLEVI